MRIANTVLDLPSDYRCYNLMDKGQYVEARVARDKLPQSCPACRKGNAVVHGHAKRSAYHTPVKAKPCILVIDLRRYRCKKRGRTFFEKVSVISECSPHMTVDLERWIISQIRLGRSLAEITRGCGASADIARLAIDAAPLPKRHLPKHLCVDEFHAFSKRRAYKEGVRQYWTVCVDGHDGRLVDVIDGHDKQTLEAWLRSFSKTEREQVEYFTCDMFDAFRRAAKMQLPNAVICIDKFHVASLVKDAFDKARRRIHKRPGKSTSDAKAIWKLLVANRAKLILAPKARPWQDQAKLDAAATAQRNKAFERIACALTGDDANHRELRRAYLMLQAFYVWAGTDFANEREMIKALGEWISQAQNCGIKEIATAAGSIKGVKEYVLNAYRTDKTNAYAENVNRKIKDMKRRACGFTNFKNMRRRLLLAFGYPPIEKGGVALPNYNE